MQRRGKLLNSGAPGDTAQVDLYTWNEQKNDWEPDGGEPLSIPSLLYFEKGLWCVVNHFESQVPGIRSGMCVTSVE